MAGPYIENYVNGPLQTKGIQTKRPVVLEGTSATLDVDGTATFDGAATFNSTVTQTGTLTPTGGVGPAGGFSNPTVFHSGGIGVVATTGLTQKQIVTTETYYAEVFIPANTTLTGISVLNGHTTSGSQNTFVGLPNST